MKVAFPMASPRVGSKFLLILAVTVVAYSFKAKSDTVVVIGPSPPGPALPSLDPDDSYVTYHYEVTGTGWWEGDYDYLQVHTDAGFEETTIHFKTNGSTVTLSTGLSEYLNAYQAVCPDGSGGDSEVYPCYSTSGSCGGATDWSTGYNGNPGFSPWDINFTSGETLSCGLFTNASGWYNDSAVQLLECGGWKNYPVMGKSSYYEIDLTLTPECNDEGWTPPPLPAPADAGMVGPSDNPTTPGGGNFDMDGNFNFSFVANGGEPYKIFASSNLLDWTFIGTETTAGDSTNGVFQDPGVATAPSLFYVVEDTNGVFSAPYGFINRSLSAGYALIADPLFNGSRQISSIFPSVPDGTTLQFWNGATWVETSTFSSGAWDTDSVLELGSGALIDVPESATITFIGQAIEGISTNSLPEGSSVVSSLFPQSGPVDALGLTRFSEGDTLQKLVDGSYVTYTYGPGWSPSMPTLGLGEAAIYDASAAENWGVVSTSHLPFLIGTATTGGAHGYGTLFQVNSDGSEFTNLYSFYTTNSLSYSGGSVVSSVGAIYGLTGGGAYGFGTMFNWTGSGFTTIYNFTAAAAPSSLALSGGTLYGMTAFGKVLSINTNGSGFTVSSTGAGSISSQGYVVSGGTLYGICPDGGDYGWGSIFSINLNGTGYTTLYSFTGGDDGWDPVGTLMVSSGTLYGTASQGGTDGCGTVFSISTNGSGFTALYSFQDGSDGAFPLSGLVLSGNTLYGTTEGDTSSPEANDGTVFAINTDGSGFTVLEDLPADGSQGANPYGALILSGNTLYGTTYGDDNLTDGTVFSVNTDGTQFSVLHSFTGESDGGMPHAALVIP
ncbi:MAG TPA: choice-of-anchor tandem repeat GloVer-containing protein [Verrucomicrobiae bacterium]|jgi:uncharacterized repeat protein (TIGR03803 family)|nr:choice-of-anchor tandem repeat GloVer-containing protein [Verrucomicrobiae bacterium]